MVRRLCLASAVQICFQTGQMRRGQYHYSTSKWIKADEVGRAPPADVGRLWVLSIGDAGEQLAQAGRVVQEVV